MDQPDVMGCVNGFGDVFHEPYSFGKAQRIFRARESMAFHKLHRDVQLFFDFSDFINAANIRMIHAGLCMRFLNKTFGHFRIVIANEFQGDITSKQRIVGFIDFAHSSFADQTNELVAIPICYGQIFDLRKVLQMFGNEVFGESEFGRTFLCRLC